MAISINNKISIQIHQPTYDIRFPQNCVLRFVLCECTVVSLGDDSTRGSSASIFTAVVCMDVTHCEYRLHGRSMGGGKEIGPNLD